MPSSVSRMSVPPNQVLAVISSRNELLTSASSPSVPSFAGSHSAFQEVGRLRIHVGVGDQRDVPGDRADRADPAVRIALDEVRLEVLGVGQLRLVQRRPELGVLALDARDLRHHADVGRGDVAARRGLQLDQPGLAGRLGDRLDLDPGLLGEIRVDVLVEGILEVAAVGADLEGRRGAGPNCWKTQDGGGNGRACACQKVPPADRRPGRPTSVGRALHGRSP